MKRITILAWQAVELLQQNPHTIESLADKLCVSCRHCQRVIKYLKSKGFSLKEQYKNRRKNFTFLEYKPLWNPLEVLSVQENLALQKALITATPELGNALTKLVLHLQ